MKPLIASITVDGVSGVQLLAKIEARNQDKRIIHLIQLPPYCPYLNPIERLWAVMHQHVTHDRAYPTQKLFTEAILKFIRTIMPEQWHNFPNQVSDNFRTISEQNIRVFE